MFSRRMTHEERTAQITIVPKTTESAHATDDIRRQMYERIARGQAMSDVEASAERKRHGRS